MFLDLSKTKITGILNSNIVFSNLIDHLVVTNLTQTNSNLTSNISPY